jgi:3-isopropylmalate/(R)-2-methylmalate dehydratase small subunit
VETWTKLTSRVAPLPYDDIDTDTIIPQVELVTVGRTGLGAGLFAHWRYDGRRVERPDFVLNQQPYRTARILATGSNFGCGSSREHAAWALADFGIRCVLAPSFGPIFYRNCLRSRIAPLIVPADTLEEMRLSLGPACHPTEATVDLTARRFIADGRSWPLDVPPEITDYVVEGLDEVERTMRGEAEIERFENAHRVPPVPPRPAARSEHDARSRRDKQETPI